MEDRVREIPLEVQYHLHLHVTSQLIVAICLILFANYISTCPQFKLFLCYIYECLSFTSLGATVVSTQDGQTSIKQSGGSHCTAVAPIKNCLFSELWATEIAGGIIMNSVHHCSCRLLPHKFRCKEKRSSLVLQRNC